MKVLVNLFFLAVVLSLFVGCGKEEKAVAPQAARSGATSAAPAVTAEPAEERKVLGACKMCVNQAPYLVVWCGFDGTTEFHSKGSEAEASAIFYGYIQASRCNSAGAFPYSSDCNCASPH